MLTHYSIHRTFRFGLIFQVLGTRHFKRRQQFFIEETSRAFFIFLTLPSFVNHYTMTSSLKDIPDLGNVYKALHP